MGTGDPRDLTCTNTGCSNGQAVKQKLLAPKALASAPDGAIYVADYNLIRKITPDGLVSSLLKLKWVIVCNLCNSTYYSLECILLWSFKKSYLETTYVPLLMLGIGMLQFRSVLKFPAKIFFATFLRQKNICT